jgi:GlpG protein
MRQLGTLATQQDAQRFTSWLLANRIEAHAEQADGGWAVWVRDEDHLPQAREALTHFREHPLDQRYQDAERSAQAVLRDEESKRQQAQRNIVEMRGRWGGGAGGISRRCPLVLALIGVSILVFIATMDQEQREMEGFHAKRPIDHNAIYSRLVITDPPQTLPPPPDFDMWAALRRGEVWRLITPIFVHYGLPHLVLNLLWLHTFGGQIEDRRGSRFMAVLVLTLALTSNLAQAVESSIRTPGMMFGGLSGVGFGLFGYMLVKVKFDNRQRYYLAPGTTFLALLWFGLCIARDVPPFASVLQGAIPPIANSAHAVGLFVGAAIAYAPLLFPSEEK